MIINWFKRPVRQSSQSGQAFVFVVLGLGLFLLGATAFAIDLSNLWFRRQAAQTAADSACTAGAMDLLTDANTGSTSTGGFNTTASTGDSNPFICGNLSKSGVTPAPCAYAAKNEFAGTLSQSQFNAGNPGNYVWFSWSPTATAPAGVTAPPGAVAGTPFLEVQVNSNMPTFFAGLLGQKGQSISAHAICGLILASAPIPIVVLDPESPPSATPAQAALNIQGTPTIVIYGGPQKSIQVDSLASASTCGSANCSVNSPWGTATINLSNGGPLGTGSDIGLSGAPSAAMTGFNGGSTGHWIAPSTPIGDPFQQVCFPGQSGCTYTIDGNSVPSAPTSVYVPPDLNTTVAPNCNPATAATIQAGNCQIPYQFHGCPDTNTGGSKGCYLYTPGAYPSGISVSGGSKTAVFDPGLYYVTGGLALASGSLARPGTGDSGNTANGMTFYFVGNGTVSVTSDSGSRTSGVDHFNSMKGPVDSTGTPYSLSTNVYPRGVQCLATSSVPTNLQGSPSGTGVNLDGNILLGPCTGYYGDPLGAAAPTAADTPPGPGEQRGFLFFQDRSATGSPAGKGVQPSWGGGGVFTLAGTMYFHSCRSDGTGLKCAALPSNYWSDIFSLGGNSGSQTYVLGEIVTDNLQLQGNATINMDLNPSTAFNILKAGLFQ